MKAQKAKSTSLAALILILVASLCTLAYALYMVVKLHSQLNVPDYGEVAQKEEVAEGTESEAESSGTEGSSDQGK